MSISKKTITTAAAVSIALTTVLTGCSDDKATTATTETVTTDKPVTLTAWIMPNSPKPDADFQTLMKPYLDKHPNVKINVTVLDWGSAWTKITTAATSGTGPDIMQLGTTWVPAIAAMNGIDKITDKVADVGGANAYLPASWKTTQIEGQPDVYAVPWFVDARAVYYRTDAFAKAGVDPKEAFKTWDSFKAALQKVNKVNIDGQEMAAFTMPGKNDWNVAHNIFPWMWEAGGEVLSPDNKKSVFNSDQALKGLTFYTSLAREGLVDKKSLEENSSQVEGDFADGKAAAIIDTPVLVKSFTTSKADGGYAEKLAAKNYAVAPLPAGPSGQATFFGGSDLTVFAGSKNKGNAWDVIKYLSGDDAQLEYAKLSGMIPAKKTVLDSSYIKDNPNLAQFKAATESGRSYPSIPQWGPTETVLVKHFGNIWDIVAGVNGTYSDASVKKELDAAAQEVDAILKQ
ncbi:sugar ABC transporter substrate-binding protein [Tumebacillus permanentifrigoris]|uniref:Multiple sugar transport system substrate-binding protein n=1 Tax=Tumebacillus permanentifrigoris TaxID=378543 RepID=A0A316DBF8_9BACL|nr:sugar ABC transporter substrate-binding protein [Tumebacillus permanentifrigoris]PWK14916.1 multiple sugar transport system substrate-binding protein [Tumebacillus permanentifrigoris]